MGSLQSWMIFFEDLGGLSTCFPSDAHTSLDQLHCLGPCSNVSYLVNLDISNNIVDPSFPHPHRQTRGLALLGAFSQISGQKGAHRKSDCSNNTSTVLFFVNPPPPPQFEKVGLGHMY